MSRPLSASARKKMIRAAARIIAELGPLACTVDEVARRSGVAKTTIYRHFGSSDALVLAAVDAGIKNVTLPDTGSLEGDLRQIISGYLETAGNAASRQTFTWMLTRSMADPSFAAMFRTVRVQPRGPTVVAIQRAIGRGEVAPDIDIDIAIHLIQGPFMSKRIVENEELTQRDIDRLLDMIVAGLRSERGSSGPR